MSSRRQKEKVYGNSRVTAAQSGSPEQAQSRGVKQPLQSLHSTQPTTLFSTAQPNIQDV